MTGPLALPAAPSSLLFAVAAGLRPYDVPVDLGREQARRLAERELADPAYHLDDPNLLERLVQWAWRTVNELLDAAVGMVPGGLWGLLVLLAVGVVVVAALFWRSGGLRRGAGAEHPLFVDRVRSAAEYRRLADRAAAIGDWEAAVRERFRAVVRTLEERTVLDPRPGRTADEAAAEAGVLLPVLAGDLDLAARTFDGVVYGGRSASSSDDRFLRELDRAAGESKVQSYVSGGRT